MLKGKTKIILTNVETGEQEIHEDENLVTTALDKIINIEMAMNHAPNDRILPIATNALGGIMLFDGELTEDVNNIHFPVEAHLVGYANQGTNTSDRYRGSYNSTESGKTEEGYVSVWDFGTHQANGVIRSLARTSNYGGQNPIVYNAGPSDVQTESGAPASDKNWCPIRYDGEYLYLLKGNTSSHVMRLARTRIPSLKFGVADYSNVARTYEVIASWNTLVTTYTYWSDAQHRYEYTREIYADYPEMYEDGHDGYIYCMFYGARGDSYRDYDYDITWFTIKYDGDEENNYTKSETHQLVSGTSYYCDSTYYVNMYYANRRWGHIYQGTLYRMSSDRKSFWKIPLDNVAGAVSTRVISAGVNDYIYDLRYFMSLKGAIWFMVYHYTESSYNYMGGVFYPDGYYVLNDVSYTGTNYYPESDSQKWNSLRTCDDDLLMWRWYDNSSYTHLYRNWAPNYLGTINNLEQVVTKTAAQTMKIVYTLTDIDEAEEEEENA